MRRLFGSVGATAYRAATLDAAQRTSEALAKRRCPFCGTRDFDTEHLNQCATDAATMNSVHKRAPYKKPK